MIIPCFSEMVSITGNGFPLRGYGFTLHGNGFPLMGLWVYITWLWVFITRGFHKWLVSVPLILRMIMNRNVHK